MRMLMLPMMILSAARLAARTGNIQIRLSVACGVTMFSG